MFRTKQRPAAVSPPADCPMCRAAGQAVQLEPLKMRQPYFTYARCPACSFVAKQPRVARLMRRYLKGDPADDQGVCCARPEYVVAAAPARQRGEGGSVVQPTGHDPTVDHEADEAAREAIVRQVRRHARPADDDDGWDGLGGL